KVSGQFHHFLLLLDVLEESLGIQVGQTTVLSYLGYGCTEEVRVAYARDLNGILECKEQSLAGTFLRGQFQKVFPVKINRPLCDLEVLVARKHRCQRALTRAVRPHDGVYLARIDGEV